MDWEAVKTEYATTSISLRKLADKYGVNPSTIMKRSRRDKWTEARKHVALKIAAKTESRVADCRASRIERLMNVADRVLDSIERTVGNKALDPQSMKYITGSLKDIQDIQGLKKTDLDLREQEARIRIIENQINATEETDETSGVILLPPIGPKEEPSDG